MAKDKIGRRAQIWQRAFWLSFAVCLLALALNIGLSELDPATNWGIGYGISAVVLLLGVVGWAVRRRAMRRVSKWNMGSARNWLYFHLYGGILFALLVLMHSAFRVPNGPLEFWLWALSLWTVLSGILGLGLQKWLPRVLTSGLSVEVLYDRIPSLAEEVRSRAEKLVQTCPDSVQALYDRELAPDLIQPRRRLIYFLDITGGIQARLKPFNYLKRFLNAEERDKLDELERLFRTKLEMDAHYTLQYALRWWLLAHVPPSLLLLLFVALHLFSVWYY